VPLVNIMVNNRAYTVACDTGEEAHLRELGAHVDSKVKELLGTVGQVGEPRLLLMAALLLADEHHDMTERLDARTKLADALEAENAEMTERLAKSEVVASDAIEAATKRLEAIAARLAHA
jgi:cell division protein ZapA